MAIGLFMPLLKLVSRCADHVIRRRRPPDPLQLELADWLDLYGVLNLHQYSRADEDLSGVGLVAQPRSDVGYRANGGVVETVPRSRLCQA